MQISRVHALAIALGLVLIGIAVSRSGVDWRWGKAAPAAAGTRTFAEGYMLRDGRLTGEPRPGAPGTETVNRSSL
jgi:hypothetical protein